MEIVFNKILDMSLMASWLILAVILVRLLLSKAPKNIRFILWILVAVRLVCPFSIESKFSLIPEKIISSQEETNDYANESIDIEENVAEQEFEEDYAQEDTYEDNEEINYSENEAVSDEAVVEEKQIISQKPVKFWLGLVWVAGIIAILCHSVISYMKLKKRVAGSVQVEKNIRVSDEIDTPFILGIISPVIYLPGDLDELTKKYVLAHEFAHIKRKDFIWKPLGFLIVCAHWFNPLVWVSYVLFSRDIEMACDEKVIAGLDVEERKEYSKALLSCSVAHKPVNDCPVAFGEVGVKSRVKYVLNYKKPAFWMIIIALAACVALGIGFLTNPKENIEEDINIMSETIFFKSTEIYFIETYSSYHPYEERFAISNGSLYKSKSNDLIGLLMPFDLTKENFEDLIAYHRLAMQIVDIEDGDVIIDNINIFENIRNSCENAWIADGENGTYLLLEASDEVFYIASCQSDESGNISFYDYLLRLEKDDVGEQEPLEVVTATDNPEIIALHSLYGEHFNECVYGYFEYIEFVSTSIRSFPNGDERLYIEPKQADDEHYFVYRHLEDASGDTDVFEDKLPLVRSPLDSIPEVIISCEKIILDEYEVFINNWLGEDNGRTKDLFKKLHFNEENTPLFEVPDWTTYRVGQFTLQFPDGQAPDVVDVEDLVLNEDGSVRYEGRPNEVVYRGATVDRINDTVDFSLADHSSISYYERATTGGSPKDPFYRGYRVRCYWGTTEGLQSVTYMFVIRTQNIN